MPNRSLQYTDYKNKSSGDDAIAQSRWFWSLSKSFDIAFKIHKPIEVHIRIIIRLETKSSRILPLI